MLRKQKLPMLNTAVSSKVIKEVCFFSFCICRAQHYIYIYYNHGHHHICLHFSIIRLKNIKISPLLYIGYQLDSTLGFFLLYYLFIFCNGYIMLLTTMNFRYLKAFLCIIGQCLQCEKVFFWEIQNHFILSSSEKWVRRSQICWTNSYRFWFDASSAFLWQTSHS